MKRSINLVDRSLLGKYSGNIDEEESSDDVFDHFLRKCVCLRLVLEIPIKFFV